MTGIMLGSFLTGIAIPSAVAHEEKQKKQESYTIGLSMYSLRNLFKDGSLKPLDYPAFAKKTFGQLLVVLKVKQIGTPCIFINIIY